ncbi:hypothetical protein K439DRAFT_680178 [Ramaria rubella]|nr:hypothetical protein K439DRAFT_680178 [Ramaria rubella]
MRIRFQIWIMLISLRVHDLDLSVYAACCIASLQLCDAPTYVAGCLYAGREILTRLHLISSCTSRTLIPVSLLVCNVYHRTYGEQKMSLKKSNGSVVWSASWV